MPCPARWLFVPSALDEYRTYVAIDRRSFIYANRVFIAASGNVRGACLLSSLFWSWVLPSQPMGFYLLELVVFWECSLTVF